MLPAVSDPVIAVSISGVVVIEVIRNINNTMVTLHLFDDSFIRFGTNLSKVFGC